MLAKLPIVVHWSSTKDYVMATAFNDPSSDLFWDEFNYCRASTATDYFAVTVDPVNIFWFKTTVKQSVIQNSSAQTITSGLELLAINSSSEYEIQMIIGDLFTSYYVRLSFTGGNVTLLLSGFFYTGPYSVYSNKLIVPGYIDNRIGFLVFSRIANYTTEVVNGLILKTESELEAYGDFQDICYYFIYILDGQVLTIITADVEGESGYFIV